MPNTENDEQILLENNFEDDVKDIIPANDMQPLIEAEKRNVFLTERQLRHHIQAIRHAIKSEEVRLRSSYPWLQHQNAIGLSIFFFGLLSVFFLFFLYLRGYIEWWVVIPLLALPVSLLHELEHDLIHNLYFKGVSWMQHFLFFTIWMTKLNLNPWYRKVLHLRHHILSGQNEDIEERFIGLGLPMGWFRLLQASYPFSNQMQFSTLRKDNKRFFGVDTMIYVVIMNLPGIGFSTLMLHLYLAFFRRLFLGWTYGAALDPSLMYPLWLWPIARDFAVLIVFPNLVRQLSLNIIASYCHYFGDIPKHNVYYQNQVLNSWWLLPLNFFCFNFGATHIIHHFVTNQPFYLRQMLAAGATRALIEHGVRVNDLDIVRRSNRYFEEQEQEGQEEDKPKSQ